MVVNGVETFNWKEVPRQSSIDSISSIHCDVSHVTKNKLNWNSCPSSRTRKNVNINDHLLTFFPPHANPARVRSEMFSHTLRFSTLSQFNDVNPWSLLTNWFTFIDNKTPELLPGSSRDWKFSRISFTKSDHHGNKVNKFAAINKQIHHFRVGKEKRKVGWNKVYCWLEGNLRSSLSFTHQWKLFNIIWFIIRQFVSETVNQVSYNCISASFFILMGFYYAMIKRMNTRVRSLPSSLRGLSEENLSRKMRFGVSGGAAWKLINLLDTEWINLCLF